MPRERPSVGGRVSICSAPARICLVGEHLDWMGGPVLTGALEELRTYVRTQPLPGSHLVIRSHDIGPEELSFAERDVAVHMDRWDDYLRAGISVLSRETGIPRSGFRVDVASTIPMSSGLSSSAALEVALIASLGRCFDLPLSKPEIAALAYSIERQELGINCGQMDPYAVALGGLLCLECGSEPPKWQMIDSRTGSMTFIVAGSGVMNDTAAILSELNDLWDAGDERLRRYFDEVAELVRDAWTLLAKDDGRSPEALGECMDRAQLHLGEDLHLSTPLLSMLCETARDSGATGAKVTGVGRGGCVVALAERDSVEGVAAALRSIADWVEVVTVSGHGLRDESEHAFREFVQRQ